MQKFNYRKYAVAALSLIMVGTMAACSGASSTDEALSHPGDVIGTVQFDVNPSAASVTVTPVGSPWSATGVPGDGSGNIPNVTLTTSNIAYAAGVMDFDVKLTWADPVADLWNVRIQVNSTTNANVTNLNDDRCTGATPWGTCLAGANPPAISFVSDLQSEGPETKNLCAPGGVICSTQYRNALSAGCGQISTHWKLSESGGAGYKFWADLYGAKAPIDPLLDPRYDQFTATQWMKVKKITYATTNVPPEGAISNSMLPNEWFYVHLYEDNPGNNQPVPYYYAEMDANASPAFLAPNHIEDTGNVARYAFGTDSSANYWYVGKFNPYTIRFDNAVVEIAANDGGVAPGLPAGFKFCTAKGTRLWIINDPNSTTDGWNTAAGPVAGPPAVAGSTDAFASSNSIGYIKCLGSNPSSLGPSVYPNPCNNPVNGMGCPAGSRDGFANLDIDYTYVPLHVKATAVSGQTSYILPAYDSNTIMVAYSTEGSPYSGSDWGQPVSRSLNWPNWCEMLPAGVCWTTGQYNLERNYVCVQ